MKRRNFLKTIVGCSVMGASATALSSPQYQARLPVHSRPFKAFNEQIISVLDELAVVYPRKTISICKRKTPHTHSVIMDTLTYNPDKAYPVIARIDATSSTTVWVYDIIDTGLKV